MTYPYEPSGGNDPTRPDRPYGYDPTGAPPLPPAGYPTSGQPASAYSAYGQPASAYSAYGQPASAYSASGQPYPGYPTSGYPTSGDPAAGYPGYGYAPVPPTNGLAIAALVCAIAGVATCVTAPVGAILGHVARRQIRERGEAGDGLALAGVIVGWILTALFAVLIVIWVIAAVLVASAESGEFTMVPPG